MLKDYYLNFSKTVHHIITSSSVAETKAFCHVPESKTKQKYFKFVVKKPHSVHRVFFFFAISSPRPYQDTIKLCLWYVAGIYILCVQIPGRTKQSADDLPLERAGKYFTQFKRFYYILLGNVIFRVTNLFKSGNSTKKKQRTQSGFQLYLPKHDFHGIVFPWTRWILMMVVAQLGSLGDAWNFN